ncbi:MAG: class I SAM-dependent methyltransferase [Labilithrix sp.]|nr:class I SAM-dependent methyltransferase [Labilithrix sp.]
MEDRSLKVALLFLGAIACGAPAREGPHADHGAPPRGRHGHHHRFDDAAGWSKVFDDPARDEWQKPERVVAAMKITPGMTVADVGAGTGYFEPHLSRAVGPSGAVIAVDVERDMVAWIDARAKREGLANVRAVLAPASDPTLPAAKVDRVLVVDTWHHIDDRPAYARKLAASLAPGGGVYIVDFTKESPHGPPPHARVSPEETIRDLGEAGLGAEVVPVDLPFQYVVRASR